MTQEPFADPPGTIPAIPLPDPRPRLFTSPVGWWIQAVETCPDAVALITHRDDGTGRLTDRRMWSYGALQRAVCAFTNRLLQAGARGGRVALLLPNGAPFFVAAYAAMAAGAQLVLLNPDYTARELTPILRDADPGIVLVPPDRADLRSLTTDAIQAEIWPLSDGELETEWQGSVDLQPPDPEGLAILQYTGGTTGLPKGVDLTHRAVAANVTQREAWVRHPVGSDKVLVVTPLFHAYGMANGLFLAPYIQGCLVLPPRYRPDWTLDLIARESVTVFAGAPTIYTGLLNQPTLAKTSFASLDICYSGGAPLAGETLSRWEATTGSGIVEGYGQTEAGPVIAYNPKDGPFAGQGRAGSIGFPVPETAIRLVDPQDGETPVPDGTAGELLVRGPQVMAGYRGRAEATKAVLVNGWLRTGDIVRREANGLLVLEDRRADMVLTGGFSVYPREIDEVLATHPDVAAVASVGVPDPYYGQVVWSYVVGLIDSEPTIEALAAHAARSLAKYKRPARILLVDDLPRTGVGKIDKQHLRNKSAKTRDGR